jgi:hypothetical protein
MDKKYIILVFALMIIAFSLTFSLFSLSNQKEDLAGQAYAYNQGVCSYCISYCGQNYPNSAGTMVSTDKNLHVKALGEGCKDTKEWAKPHQDIVLCCR